MNKKCAKRWAILSVVVMVLSAGVLTGCGRAGGFYAAKPETMPRTGDSYPDKYAPEAVYESDEVYDYAASEEEAAKTSSSLAAGTLQLPENVSDKLIYSGSIRLQTLEYDKTMESIHRRIGDAGGFVQYEDESDGNDTWYYSGSANRGSTRYATIQARIPAGQFSDFMDALGDDGQVMNRNINVDNISQTYADTEASVKAYEIEQERLLDMMDKAETIEDMIAVEARLSEVEAELNSYKTSLASMDRDVDYSTVSIAVEEVREYTEERDDTTFLSRLKETVKDSRSGFLWFMEGLLHLFIRLLPFIIVILVIFLIVHGIVKKTEPRRLARRTAKAQKKMQKYMERQQKYMQRHPGKLVPPQNQGMPPQNQDTLPQSPDTKKQDKEQDSE